MGYEASTLRYSGGLLGVVFGVLLDLLLTAILIIAFIAVPLCCDASSAPRHRPLGPEPGWRSSTPPCALQEVTLWRRTGLGFRGGSPPSPCRGHIH